MTTVCTLFSDQWRFRPPLELEDDEEDDDDEEDEEDDDDGESSRFFFFLLVLLLLLLFLLLLLLQLLFGTLFFNIIEGKAQSKTKTETTWKNETMQVEFSLHSLPPPPPPIL